MGQRPTVDQALTTPRIERRRVIREVNGSTMRKSEIGTYRER